jgi:hypothetical protein
LSGLLGFGVAIAEGDLAVFKSLEPAVADGNAVHLWADCSRKYCAWAGTYYRAQREKGKSHACALRCLGQRWLKILWKMWQSHRPYDETLHALNQQRHGSWVLQLEPQKT